MKQFLKNTTAAVLISVTLGTGSVCAGQVEAPTETISVLGMFVQKISKVGFYIDTITEGVTYVSSVGKKGFNAAVGALSSMAGNLSGFQDMLHFADASSFNALLDKAESTIDTVKEDVGLVNDAIDSAKENINTATGLVEKAKNENVDKTLIYATAAVRLAKNRQVFIDKIKDTCGICVDVISGDMETVTKDASLEEVFLELTNA